MNEYMIPFVIGGLLAISGSLIAELLHDKRKLQKKLDAIEETRREA